MIMYETKATAASICKGFERIKRRSGIATAIAFFVLCFAFSPLIYNAYDKENIVGLIICALAVIILTVVAGFVTGAILSRSLKTYLSMQKLCTKWAYARKEMHEYEAKFADQTVFEPDLKKAEKRLMDASEALIAYAKDRGIEFEEI